MNKEQIKKEYNKLVSEIEEKKMYDGRNTVDRYICKRCGAHLYTTYIDKGVTPFTIQCRKCSLGTMMHDKTFRKETVPPYVVVLGWYRPTLEQSLKMSDAAIHHVLQGGLFLEDEINVNSNDND
jgi:ribosomal protein L40E